MEMMTRKRITLGLLAAAMAGTLLADGCKGSRTATRTDSDKPMAEFTVNLTGGQEVPPVQTVGAGTGTVKLSPERNVVTYNIMVGVLSGPITAAHFHRGGMGQSGPPVKTLSFDNNMVAAGNWTMHDASEPLTRELVEALLAGNLYINVHSSNNPNGEIRGQVTNASNMMASPAPTPH